MSSALSTDIFHVLCEILAVHEQFDTLFNCACTSRALAIPALTNLYRHVLPAPMYLDVANINVLLRYHHLASVKGGGDDEAFSLATKQLLLQRWAILWRSIIASSLNATLFPYCRYIRTLDFRDLKNLLEDEKFQGSILK